MILLVRSPIPKVRSVLAMLFVQPNENTTSECRVRDLRLEIGVAQARNMAVRMCVGERIWRRYKVKLDRDCDVGTGGAYLSRTECGNNCRQV